MFLSVKDGDVELRIFPRFPTADFTVLKSGEPVASFRLAATPLKRIAAVLDAWADDINVQRI